MSPLTAHQLTRRFGRYTAVAQFSGHFPAGSVSVICGANGAGKTTALRLMLGLLPASYGHATIFGVDHRQLGPREWARIGYVSEDLQHHRALTVDTLLARWRSLYPQWDRQLERRIVDALELPRHQRLTTLSRGQRMKAHLASVLPYRPELLVLDEPFSGLDLVTRDQVVQQLVDLVAEDGTTVLVSSHEISDVETLADRLLWIRRGHLRLETEIESLRARFRRVTQPFGEPPPHVWQVQRHEDGSVSYIDPQFDPATSPPEATATALPLRDIYLALVRGPQPTLPPPVTIV
ncbi:ABC transporter ATP-binding protein [Actomonas aquatica]|uniref:ABC transporter ATP-binding protein n=1 Tax=Actomonas aquatica TaxID=2866162 RepID=A0ABZ1C441_9BACT|nr:ABC transporter ATP-binding protein [Opitutus sp. WL0086]WRQ86271.1 ABC transporter ATP-binding protein [Opitutus sp. WL0086]